MCIIENHEKNIKNADHIFEYVEFDNKNSDWAKNGWYLKAYYMDHCLLYGIYLEYMCLIHNLICMISKGLFVINGLYYMI